MRSNRLGEDGRYGHVEFDEARWIFGFVEKSPMFSGSAFINAGLYLLSASLLGKLADSRQ
jgi:hypothetical protein